MDGALHSPQLLSRSSLNAVGYDRSLIFFWSFALFFLSGCGHESSTQSFDGFSTSSITRSTMSLPPYNYSQSPNEIPQTPLNDPYLKESGPWDLSLPLMWDWIGYSLPQIYNHLEVPQRDIVVAVIDTGIDYDHPELKGRLWINQNEFGNAREKNGIDDDGDGYPDDFMGWNFVDNNNHPIDDSGHGTHVTGTIVASANNHLGMLGVAPWVRIMPLKVCNSAGRCNTSNIRAAILYAADHHADVINLSLGGPANPDEFEAFENVLEKARSRGSLVVVAAGNNHSNINTSVPGANTWVVSVSAHNQYQSFCRSFSNFGYRVDLSAPGCVTVNNIDHSGILSLNSRKCGPSGEESCCAASHTEFDNFYCFKQGTSMAAPHISGLAAIMKTEFPDLTLERFLQTLTSHNSQSSALKSYELGSQVSLATFANHQLAPGLKILRPHLNGTQVTIALSLQATAGLSLRYYKASRTNQDIRREDLVPLDSSHLLSDETSLTISQNWNLGDINNSIFVAELSDDQGHSWLDFKEIAY